MGHLTPTTLQTIDISLSGDNHSAKTPRPVHTYTTYDDIRGHVAISALTPTPFSRVEIFLLGTTRTAHTDHTVPVIAEPQVTHIFLRMAMPIPPSAYPPPSGSSDTYLLNPGCPLHIPFHFVVPARLLPHACRHEHSSASVPEAHTQLPPSLGSFLLPRDDLTFEVANISYSIYAKLLAPSPTSKPSKILSSAIRKFHVVPASEEAPPLLVANDYSTTRLLPASPAHMRPSRAFRPHRPNLNPTLRSHRPLLRAAPTRIPDQELQGSPYDSHSRAFKTYVALAAQDVPAAAAPLWRVVPAPKYARRDSGYSTAWSLSPTPSPNSSPTPLATSTGPLVSVSAASASGDVDEVDDKKPYYTTIALRLVLAPSRTWIPTFHSCFISRFYTLVLELVVHPPGAAMPFMLSLEVPVQVIGQGREGRKEAFVAGGRAGSVGMGEGGDMRGLGGVWDGYAAGGGESVDAYGGCGGEEMGQGDELLPAYVAPDFARRRRRGR